MSIKLDSKIVSFQVVKPAEEAAAKAAAAQANEPTWEEMHEHINRPQHLEGTTYKIKPPISEHAIYVTINDVVLNAGSEHEVRRPFEIFINSKNMEHYQWISALTLIISAVFRQGGDCTFLVEELGSVFDPKGGYMKRGGRWMPSLVAEIGEVLKEHLTRIGMIKNEVDAHKQAYIEQKRAELAPKGEGMAYPESAQICKKCNTKAAVQMDGCLTCLSCGDSKCG